MLHCTEYFTSYAKRQKPLLRSGGIVVLPALVHIEIAEAPFLVYRLLEGANRSSASSTILAPAERT